jgi:formylmethanofuran dehydrogenase subunit D
VTRLTFEPTDFASLGVVEGGSIEVRGPKGNVSVVVGPDPRVVKGTAHVLFNQQGVSAGDLIDATATVVDLTVVPV